jgi:hypothetical protein
VEPRARTRKDDEPLHPATHQEPFKTAFRDVDACYLAVRTAFLNLQRQPRDPCRIRAVERANLALSSALIEFERTIFDLHVNVTIKGSGSDLAAD